MNDSSSVLTREVKNWGCVREHIAELLAKKDDRDYVWMIRYIRQ